MSVLLGYNNSMYHEGFNLPLDIIVTRDESTWTPHLDIWSAQAWENLTIHATKSWRSMQYSSFPVSDIEGALVNSLNEIERISSPTTVVPASSHRYGEVLWQGRWRLVCFCVDVQFTDDYMSSPFDRVEGEDLTTITSLLNRSPLFPEEISTGDVEAAIYRLRLVFYPPAGEQEMAHGAGMVALLPSLTKSHRIVGKEPVRE
jgi:hypothetical protein